MSDLGETFKLMKEFGKEKRVKNLASSTNLLKEKGVAFEKKNHGVHLIVQGKDGKIDYWPSTGKFIARNGGKGRGVFNLLKLCDTETVDQERRIEIREHHEEEAKQGEI